MVKPLFCALVWCVAACNALGQQLPMLSQFQESAGVLNPAAISSLYFQYEQNAQFTATHHNQWTGIEGNPRTSQLVGQILFDDYAPVAPIAGVYFINDQTGPTGLTGLYAKFGGVLSDDPYDYGISAAFQFGINQYRLRISELDLRDQETVYASGDDNRIYPDAGIGIFAYKRFGESLLFGGVSAPQILGLNLNFRGNDGTIQTQRYRHYYAQLGLQYDLGDFSFLEPVAWVKFVPDVPVNVSMTLRYQTPSAFFLGLGGTSASTFHGEAGVVLGDRTGSDPMMRIGYGFDYGFATYGSYAGPSHEIHLSYSFNR